MAPISINGTTGISGVDGSAGTPALQGTDANTGIAFGSDVIIGSTGGTERWRTDASGRLLVGTSTSRGDGSPFQVVADSANPIEVFRGETSANGPTLLFNKSRGSTASPSVVSQDDQIGAIAFKGYSGAAAAYRDAALIQAFVDGQPDTSGDTTDMPGRLVLSTTADGASSPTERMRITQAGNMLIGCTATPGSSVAGAGFIRESNGRSTLFCASSSTASNALVAFFNPNGFVGGIATDGSATFYNTSSDYRLKENVSAVTGAIDRLQQLKPSRFNFKADPGKTVDGFLAHEAAEVVPECVTGTKDAVNDEGNPIYQGIDQSKLVPLLTAALQEAIGRIEQLEAKVAALEAQ